MKRFSFFGNAGDVLKFLGRLGFAVSTCFKHFGLFLECFGNQPVTERINRRDLINTSRSIENHWANNRD
jgi:hypothetical protein